MKCKYGKLKRKVGRRVCRAKPKSSRRASRPKKKRARRPSVTERHAARPDWSEEDRRAFIRDTPEVFWVENGKLRNNREHR